MSKLTDIAKKERAAEMARNSYQDNKHYDSQNPNALSDGDEKGKGEKNGSIGSKTDIATRNKEMGMNQYNGGKPYGYHSV